MGDVFIKAYFDNRFEVKIRFATEEELTDEDGHNDAMFEDGEILVHEDFKRHPDMAAICLLHELGHADMPEYPGHGFRFGGTIDGLYKRGAYDDLL